VAQARVFFALPEADKRELLLDQRMRGYLPLYYRSYEGEERAGTSHQEGFWIGYDTALDPLRPLDGPNQWPPALPQLRRAMLAYLDSVEALSQRMLRLFASALELPVDALLANFTRPTSRLKLNHYPPQQDPLNENNIGVVPHSDSGCFTILWQDDNGGLEVQNQQGDWVGAPPLEGSFVVNIGNILQYWSNGRFSSTPHRVINRNGGDRYSVPFFVNTDFDTVIRPLPAGDNAGFEAFEYGKYQVDLWRNTFPLANIP
jgi:isopenicillin N synthase-like dioxygenase